MATATFMTTAGLTRAAVLHKYVDAWWLGICQGGAQASDLLPKGIHKVTNYDILAATRSDAVCRMMHTPGALDGFLDNVHIDSTASTVVCAAAQAV